MKREKRLLKPLCIILAFFCIVILPFGCGSSDREEAREPWSPWPTHGDDWSPFPTHGDDWSPWSVPDDTDDTEDTDDTANVKSSFCITVLDADNVPISDASVDVTFFVDSLGNIIFTDSSTTDSNGEICFSNDGTICAWSVVFEVTHSDFDTLSDTSFFEWNQDTEICEAEAIVNMTPIES